jgi:hypothetical protein
MAIQVNLLLWGCKSWALRKDLLIKLERFVNQKVRSILNLNMWHVKDKRITTKMQREMFNDIPTMQTLVDVRTMKFLGSLIRGCVDLPPRQMLIAYVPNTRHVGRPLKSNKETMRESLKRLFEPVQAIQIDFRGSMKDFYLDALDKAFWNKCVDHLRDPSLPVPKRPNRNASYHPRRSTRNRNRGDSTAPSGDRSSSQQTGGRANAENAETNEPRSDRTSRDQDREQGSVSPPRRSERRERTRGQNQPYDPANVGRVMYDSLKIFNLGYGATLAEVRAQYRALARIYHPDKHPLYRARTGKTDAEAQQFFRLLNNANEYLCSKL